MLEFNIKNKPVEVKFNLKLMFKMNKKLATTNQENGTKNNDGVGVFFNKVVNKDIEAIIELIELHGKYTEAEALEAIEDYLNDSDELQPLFEDIKDEMVNSGFFKEQISKYLDNLEKVQKYLKGEDTETQIQKEAIKDQYTQMKDALK